VAVAAPKAGATPARPAAEALMATPEHIEDGFGDLALPGSTAAAKRAAAVPSGCGVPKLPRRLTQESLMEVIEEVLAARWEQLNDPNAVNVPDHLEALAQLGRTLGNLVGDLAGARSALERLHAAGLEGYMCVNVLIYESEMAQAEHGIDRQEGFNARRPRDRGPAAFEVGHHPQRELDSDEDDDGGHRPLD
jgi:hypothetical protein